MHRSAACLLVAALQVHAIDVRIYSEFQRFDWTGSVVQVDRAAATREVLSPAVVRNAFTSFRVVVTGRPNTLYFLSVQTNPPDVFKIKLYRETVDQALAEERNPAFLSGVTPPIRNVSETAATYLLDVWVPADMNPGVVRLEVQLKTAYWRIAPLEFRVLPIVTPSLASCTSPAAMRADNKPADTVAFRILFAGLTGNLPPCVPPPANAACLVARNAAQDAALAQTLDSHTQATLLSAMLELFSERAWALFHPRGSESYLPLRQRIQREALAQHERQR
jgi:hypothetical protein